jgi:hypothetical protein
MVDSVEAMPLKDEQDAAQFSEPWEDAALLTFCNLLN